MLPLLAALVEPLDDSVDGLRRPLAGLADVKELLVLAVDPPGAPGVAGVDGDRHIAFAILDNLDARAVPAVRPRPKRRLPIAFALDVLQRLPAFGLPVLDLESVGVLGLDVLFDVVSALVPDEAAALPEHLAVAVDDPPLGDGVLDVDLYLDAVTA